VFIPAEDSNVENMLKNLARAHREALRRIESQWIVESVSGGNDPADARRSYELVWSGHRKYRNQLWNQGCKTRILKELNVSCSVNERRFDEDLDVAPCENGVLQQESGKISLVEHSRERLVTKRLGGGIVYDPHAQCPLFHHFLGTSVPDESQREWLQGIMGAALFGRPWKGFVNLIGKTDSGKSTFSRLMQRIFGSYSKAVSIETFLLGTTGNRDFRTHELKGVRLAVAGEPGIGRRLDSEIIKSLTGGDSQRTRTMYSKFVEWEPCVTIMIASNHPMKLETSDVAMLNRVGPVRFSNEHDIDQTLERRLEKETSGILNWLIEGAEQIISSGHVQELPSSMLELREYMAEDIDDTLQFLAEGLSEGRYQNSVEEYLTSYVSTNDLYHAYQLWASQEGIKYPVGKKTFTQRIGRRYKVSKSRFLGLTNGRTVIPGGIIPDHGEINQ
jgi:putative DNA primase/helicase